MRERLRRAVGRFRDWLARRPLWFLLLLGLGGAAGAGSGGYFAYRTYDWVEHDNDFCMSCHLMQQPYELFAQSAHQGLGCKACHKPTFVARSQMALTQVLESPDTIDVHAEVPNEKCASCHIEGDPEKWETVANSAGHRVHLESDDPDLSGLQCVECHSSSLHQFTATDETCGQSGCHTDIRVQLGRMGDFTIHCAACHGFSAPVEESADVATARTALAPTGAECLSCHVMRTLVDMPPDEPHDAVCSTCHNPHTQTTPAQAVESCATVACHSDPTELTAFHRGLDHVVVEDCSACHTAHEFQIQGDDCLSCHQDIFDDEAPGGVGAGPLAANPHVGGFGVPATRPIRFASAEIRPSAPAPASFRHVAVRQEAPVAGGEVVFRHSSHRDVDCMSCHAVDEEHGRLTVSDITDCRSCHHTEPEAGDCQTCHTPAVLSNRPLEVGWPMEFSWGEDRVSDVDFTHGLHEGTDCSTCHQSGLLRPPDVASCNTCHQDHHTVEATCVGCHAPPVDDAHDVQSHLGCTGAGCHSDLPFEGMPRQRDACLSCHQDLQDHRPDGECIECHSLPPARAGRHP